MTEKEREELTVLLVEMRLAGVPRCVTNWYKVNVSKGESHISQARDYLEQHNADPNFAADWIRVSGPDWENID